MVEFPIWSSFRKSSRFTTNHSSRQRRRKPCSPRFSLCPGREVNSEGGPSPERRCGLGHIPTGFQGVLWPPAEWTSEIAAVRERIRARYGGAYNSVLLNRYSNEDDSVSWHSDDEPEMDPAHPIASLSLGAPRVFRVRLSGSKDDAQSYRLTSGSLLVMPAGFQRVYQHCVPKSKTPCGDAD